MSKLNLCEECNEVIEGQWDSQVALGIETGEMEDTPYKHFIYDKHIRCSPSRAQRIIHKKFPAVIDERPQFDWRPEADNSWTDEMRVKYKKLYTEAWVTLQLKFNPTWRNNYAKHCKN